MPLVRILLVSTTAIGDTIMATPFIRAVREKYPEAHITVMAHFRRMAILGKNPHFNELLPYYGKGKKVLRTLWALKQGKFDLAIVLHANDPDVVPLVKWTGAPQRIGWGESKSAHLFTHTILRTDPPEHFLEHKRRLLESFGIPVASLQTEIFLGDEDRNYYHESLLPWLQKISSARGFVAMHAFGTNSKKWWPLEHFFSMSEHIFSKEGMPSVFVGDNEALSVVENHPRFDPLRHFAAKDSNLRESAFLLKQAHRMLTTDSGPLHMAFAVRCPTLSLFGPTQPSIHGPAFDMDRHAVIQHDPLVALSVEEVRKAWDKPPSGV